MAWRVPLGTSSPRTIQRRDVARYPSALAVFPDAAKRGRQAGRRSNSSHALVAVTAPLRLPRGTACHGRRPLCSPWFAGESFLNQ